MKTARQQPDAPRIFAERDRHDVADRAERHLVGAPGRGQLERLAHAARAQSDRPRRRISPDLDRALHFTPTSIRSQGTIVNECVTYPAARDSGGTRHCARYRRPRVRRLGGRTPAARRRLGRSRDRSAGAGATDGRRRVPRSRPHHPIAWRGARRSRSGDPRSSARGSAGELGEAARVLASERRRHKTAPGCVPPRRDPARDSCFVDLGLRPRGAATRTL